MYPASLEPNAAMPRPTQQIVAQKTFKVIEYPRLARRMETVAPVIHLHSRDLKASGVPSDRIALLEHGNVGFALFYELPCRADACRSRSEYHDPRSCHSSNRRTG